MDEALMDAIETDQAGRVRDLLIERASHSRADVGLDQPPNLSTLQLAAFYAPEAAALLLKRGVECDLHSACALGRTEDIRELTSGAEDSFGSLAEDLTPMGAAIVWGKAESVRCLLDAGDDPNRTVPRSAFYRWDVRAMRAGVNKWSPLHLAALHGYREDAPEILRVLLDNGADVASTCPLGERAIHLAVTHGWTASASLLLDLGEDVDARTDEVPEAIWKVTVPPSRAEPARDLTPLMLAAREGQTDCVRLALARGANLSALDSNGSTALHSAAAPWWKENPTVVQLLLAAGARPRKDLRGRTPLDLARAAGNSETAAILSSH